MHYAIFLTTKNGEEVRCEGPEDAIAELEQVLAKAGYWFNDDAESWHNGFYGSDFEPPTVNNDVV